MEEYSVAQAFRGRHVFITGCTGFVGKVLLEKCLRCIPELAQVYVLIRERKHVKANRKFKEQPFKSAATRFEKEILSSAIWTRLKAECAERGQDFQAYVKDKVTAVPGDISIPGLGLQPAFLEVFKKHVQIVLHCAASVDFNERIDAAVRMNVQGAMRMLEMAKTVDDLKAFVHISTAYVNCNKVQPKSGFAHPRPLRVREEIYPLDFGPQQVVDRVLQLSEEELQAFTLQEGLDGVGREWPNTYTFSKCLGENIIRDNRGDCPVAIIRPSIIGCSWKEPVPGWIDSVMAAGAVYSAIGMGAATVMPGTYDNIASLVPVDLLINTIIATVPALIKNTVLARAKGLQPSLLLCHSCTSDVQPAYRWRAVKYNLIDYFTKNPPARRLATPTIRLTSAAQFNAEFFLKYTLPAHGLRLMAKISQKEQHIKLANDFDFLRGKLVMLTGTFGHFMRNHWVFDCHNTRWIIGSLPAEEKASFFDSSVGINWSRYTELFCYGLTAFVMKNEQAEPVASREEYVNPFGNMSEYTDSKLLRLQYDVTQRAKLLSEAMLGKAGKVWAALQNRHADSEEPPSLLAKL